MLGKECLLSNKLCGSKIVYFKINTVFKRIIYSGLKMCVSQKGSKNYCPEICFQNKFSESKAPKNAVPKCWGPELLGILTIV